MSKPPPSPPPPPPVRLRSDDGRGRLWAIILALIVGIGVMATVRHNERRSDIRAAYAAGESIGRVKGMCETLQAVADANPDSAWAISPRVVSALEACRRAEQG